MSGWGNTVLLDTEKGIKGVQSSDVPKRVQLTLISKKQCKYAINGMKCGYCDKDSMLCAHGIRLVNTTVVEDSCQADSGGIVFQSRI